MRVALLSASSVSTAAPVAFHRLAVERTYPTELAAAVARGAVVVDIRSHAERAAQGTLPGALAISADLVAERLGLPNHTIAWQSAGRTADPWWGPPIEDVVAALADAGHPAVVVCSAGFVADHLEILYDLDLELREEAEGLGVRLVRTEMPNADPRYVAMLAEVIREHLAAEPAR